MCCAQLVVVLMASGPDFYFLGSSPVFPHSFYRYVLEPEVLFQADGSFSAGPMAKFLDMPQSPLFTLNLNTPESWMVESVNTRYDLDNIYLDEVGVTAYPSLGMIPLLESLRISSTWTGGECCGSRIRAGTSVAGRTLL